MNSTYPGCLPPSEEYFYTPGTRPVLHFFTLSVSDIIIAVPATASSVAAMTAFLSCLSNQEAGIWRFRTGNILSKQGIWLCLTATTPTLTAL